MPTTILFNLLTMRLSITGAFSRALRMIAFPSSRLHSSWTILPNAWTVKSLRLGLHHQSSRQLIHAHIILLHGVTLGTFPQGRVAWLHSGFVYRTWLIRIKLGFGYHMWIYMHNFFISFVYVNRSCNITNVIDGCCNLPSLAVAKYFLLAHSLITNEWRW